MYYTIFKYFLIIKNICIDFHDNKKNIEIVLVVKQVFIRIYTKPHYVQLH